MQHPAGSFLHIPMVLNDPCAPGGFIPDFLRFVSLVLSHPRMSCIGKPAEDSWLKPFCVFHKQQEPKFGVSCLPQVVVSGKGCPKISLVPFSKVRRQTFF